MKKHKTALKTVKRSDVLREFVYLFCARNGAKIYIFVPNYLLYVFTNAERKNNFVMTSYKQRNKQKILKLLRKHQNLVMFFLNLCIYWSRKWCQNTHICI